MRKGLLIGLLVLAGLLLSACRETFEDLLGDNPTLGLVVEFPETMPETRGEVGELPASSIENGLHSLLVWVFRSDNHELVTKRTLDESDFPVGGGVRRYSLPVSREFASAKPAVDVFVLANAAAVQALIKNNNNEEVSCTITEDSDWDTLNNVYFKDSDAGPYYGFGLAHPVHDADLDATLGLPMSVCRKNCTVLGEAPVLRVETVRLGRTVSRLRYVFCKTRSEGGDEDEPDAVRIDQIVLNGTQLPKKEYLFTAGTTGIVLDQAELNDNYLPEAYVVNWPVGLALAENSVPENLVYVNQDPQTYRKLLDDAVAAGELTDLGHTYFRETDRRLMGRIDYTVVKNNVERHSSREFNMAAEGDFARNHTWTLFGYFLGGRNLQLSLSVQPWDYNQYLVDYSDQSVNVPKKFTVDEQSVEMVETSKDHFDVYLPLGHSAKCHLIITTPVGGRLMIYPQGDAYAFTVTKDIVPIDPTDKSGRIDFYVRRNADLNENLTGKYITLSFSVETADGRTIDANTEIVDKVYRFVL